jgi:hypothetical protein
MLSVAAVCVPAEEVLRIRVSAELEQVVPRFIEDPTASGREAAQRSALAQASLVLGGMIYGWDFDYEIGERVRGIAERFTLTERGRVVFGDPRLTVTDAETNGDELSIWTEYRPDEAQMRRLAAWKSGGAKPVTGLGTAALTDEAEGKRAALEDAARAAIRAFLRGTERNRPKEARGAIALVAEPRWWIESGRWTSSARFRLFIDEIVPFSAY